MRDHPSIAHPSSRPSSPLPGLYLLALLLAAGLWTLPAVAAELPDSPATPRILRAVNDPLSHRLEAAFPLAWQRLEQPSCAGLFHGLRRGAQESLATTFYTAASAAHEQRLCRQAVALTAVGRPVTFVCRAFGRLAVERAAATLIHEALHHAGLPESPADPQALNSGEINARVARHCGL